MVARALWFHAAAGHQTLLDMRDMSEYRVRLEPTVEARYAGYDIHCCGPWSQGPSLAQTMVPCLACCLVGLPVGIWSLVVLLNAEVKAAFKS